MFHRRGAAVRSLILGLLAWTVLGASGPAPRALPWGRLALRTFGPAELGAEPQNWSVAEDARGRIFVGNSSGVLEHDGVRWRLIPTPMGSTPRAMAADGQGRVYVGGRGEFGWLDTGRDGQTRFVSLLERVPEADRAFTEIWSVGAEGGAVVFCARERCFRWDGRELQVWRPRGTFYSAYAGAGRCLVVDTARGLLDLGKDGLVPVPGGEAFQAERPRFMLPEAGGSWLWGSRTQGLMRFSGGRSQPVPSEANPYLVKHLLYAGRRLRDGSLALGTIHGGVVLLDPEGRGRGFVGRAEGLADPTVYTVFESKRGGLWLGQSRGVTHLEWPVRFSTFEETRGLDGVVVALHHGPQGLFASTQRGLFRWEEGGGRFRAITGLQGQCWSLLSHGGRTYVANFAGLHEVAGDRARLRRGDVGHAIALLACPWDPARLLIGTDRGLLLVDPLRPERPPEGPLGGFSDVVQTLVPDGAGGVWVGCDAPEAFRVAQGPGGTPVTEAFGPAQGLPASTWYFTAPMPGGPVIYTAQGLYRRGALGRFEPDPRTAGLFNGEAPLTRVALSPDGGLWLAFLRPGNLLRQARPGPGGTYVWDGAPAFSFQGSQVYAVLPEASGVVWFGGVEGLMRVEPHHGASQEGDGTPFLRVGLASGGSVVEAGAADPVLPAGARTLRFEFGLPRRGTAYAPRYQVQLEGRDRGWSEWRTEGYQDHPGLREGRYRFRVRAQAGLGGPVGEASFTFQIAPPWYRRLWAYGLYGVLTVGGLAALHRARTRGLERQAEALSRRIRAATEDLTRTNRDLHLANAQKDRFLQLVTHDLRNPLHGIALAAERLQGARALAEVAPVAQRIEEESRALGDQVTRVLTRALEEAGPTPPELVPVDVGQALQRAEARHRAQAEVKQLILLREGPDSVPAAQAEPHLLDRVLDNLLSNAVKFSPPGKRIHLGAEGLAEGVALWVRDEGPGIPEGDRSRLFTRFARLGPQPTGGEPTFGLGLAMAQEIVTLMGGHLGMVPEPGGGSCFRVVLKPSPGGTRPR